MRVLCRGAHRIRTAWLVVLAVVGLEVAPPIGCRVDRGAAGRVGKKREGAKTVGVKAAYAQAAAPPANAPQRPLSHVELRYVAPTGCPMRGAFADAVRLLTTRVVFVGSAASGAAAPAEAAPAEAAPAAAAPAEAAPAEAAPADITVWEVAIAKRGAVWRGRVSVGARTAPEHRDLAQSEVTGTSCASVHAALALTAALSIDPDAGSTRGAADDGGAGQVALPSHAASLGGDARSVASDHNVARAPGSASTAAAPETMRPPQGKPLEAAERAAGPTAAPAAIATAHAFSSGTRRPTSSFLPVGSVALGGRGIGAFAVTASMRAALARRRMEFGGGARYTLTRVVQSAAPRDTAPLVQTGSLRVQQFVIAPNVCWRAQRFGRSFSSESALGFAQSQYTVQLCVEGELGISQAKAAAIVNASTVHRGWVSVGPSVVLRRWFSARWAAQLGIGIQYNTTRADYILAPNTVLLRTPATTPWLELGLVWQ